MSRQFLRIKTRRSALKRYRKTKNKKVIYKHPYLSHILEKKSAKRKRNLRTRSLMAKGDMKNINIMLPYFYY